MPSLDAAALDTIFLNARTYPAFLPTPVDDALLQRVYELARMGPTSANCQPLRVVFVKGEAARAQLLTCVAPGNVEKTKAAPVVAVLAADTGFAEHMPRLFPSWPNFAGAWAAMPEAQQQFMLAQNGSLQAAYFIVAARSLGLDCGPMGGFDREKTNAAFFPDGRYKAQVLVRLGYGDPASLHPRGDRLSFDEACRIA